MASVAKIGSILSTVVKSPNIRKIVYSTGGSKPTFFDAFKAFNSKPHMAEKLAKRINEVSCKIQSADEILRPMCDDLGEFGSRIKKVDKITGKIPRAIKDLSLDDAVEYIANGKITNVIGDGYGARIIINNPKDVPVLLRRLADAHKSGKLKLTLVENYRGNGINPYINGNNMRMLNEIGAGKNITLNKIKSAGYTRANTDMFIDGFKIEFQIGGKHTTRFGEVEHYLHDMRLNGDGAYNKYLTQVWKCFKEAEEKSLLSVVLPELPPGIPKILSAENLLKLEKINCKKLLRKC